MRVSITGPIGRATEEEFPYRGSEAACSPEIDSAALVVGGSKAQILRVDKQLDLRELGLDQTDAVVCGCMVHHPDFNIEILATLKTLVRQLLRSGRHSS